MALILRLELKQAALTNRGLNSRYRMKYVVLTICGFHSRSIVPTKVLLSHPGFNSNSITMNK